MLLRRVIGLIMLFATFLLGLILFITNANTKPELGFPCYHRIRNPLGQLPPKNSYKPYIIQSTSLANDFDSLNQYKAIELSKAIPSDIRIYHFDKAMTAITYYDKLFAKYSKRFTGLRYEASIRTSKKCRDDSVASEVSKQTLYRLRKYLRLLQDNYKSLHECKSILVPKTQNVDFELGTVKSDLFEPENVQLYKIIHRELRTGIKQQLLMAIIDEMLFMIFELSQICHTRHMAVRENPDRKFKDLYKFSDPIVCILDGQKTNGIIAKVEDSDASENPEKADVYVRRNKLRQLLKDRYQISVDD